MGLNHIMQLVISCCLIVCDFLGFSTFAFFHPLCNPPGAQRRKAGGCACNAKTSQRALWSIDEQVALSKRGLRSLQAHFPGSKPHFAPCGYDF